MGRSISKQFIKVLLYYVGSTQGPFIRLVNRTLKTKADEPNADTGKLEREIDQLV